MIVITELFFPVAEIGLSWKEGENLAFRASIVNRTLILQDEYLA